MEHDKAQAPPVGSQAQSARQRDAASRTPSQLRLEAVQILQENRATLLEKEQKSRAEWGEAHQRALIEYKQIQIEIQCGGKTRRQLQAALVKKFDTQRAEWAQELQRQREEWMQELRKQRESFMEELRQQQERSAPTPEKP